MKGTKAAQRYAKAVLEDAIGNGQADEVFGDMESIAGTVGRSKELKSVLKSPVIKAADKRAALLEIFKNTGAKSQNLIKVLVENQRIGLLEKVAHAYIGLYNEHKGVKVATVTTALPITQEIESQVLAKVKQFTGSSTVSLQNIVDPDIIGGFILRVGDLEYNASIANNLNKLKREFTIN